MAGQHEIVALRQVISEHAQQQAERALAPHKTDIGDVAAVTPEVLIVVRGNQLRLPAAVLYWAQYWTGSAWVDVCPPTRLAVGDRVALVATDAEYMVVGKLKLGG